jgi:hypothetical protein
MVRDYRRKSGWWVVGSQPQRTRSAQRKSNSKARFLHFARFGRDDSGLCRDFAEL